MVPDEVFAGEMDLPFLNVGNKTGDEGPFRIVERQEGTGEIEIDRGGVDLIALVREVAKGVLILGMRGDLIVLVVEGVVGAESEAVSVIDDHVVFGMQGLEFKIGLFFF